MVSTTLQVTFGSKELDLLFLDGEGRSSDSSESYRSSSDSSSSEDEEGGVGFFLPRRSDFGEVDDAAARLLERCGGDGPLAGDLDAGFLDCLAMITSLG